MQVSRHLRYESVQTCILRADIVSLGALLAASRPRARLHLPTVLVILAEVLPPASRPGAQHGPTFGAPDGPVNPGNVRPRAPPGPAIRRRGEDGTMHHPFPGRPRGHGCEGQGKPRKQHQEKPGCSQDGEARKRGEERSQSCRGRHRSGGPQRSGAMPRQACLRQLQSPRRLRRCLS